MNHCKHGWHRGECTKCIAEQAKKHRQEVLDQWSGRVAIGTAKAPIKQPRRPKGGDTNEVGRR